MLKVNSRFWIDIFVFLWYDDAIFLFYHDDVHVKRETRRLYRMSFSMGLVNEDGQRLDSEIK